MPAPAAPPAAPARLAERIRSERAALEGERKQVTVLFADLVESMTLAQQVDPEQWLALMDGFFQSLAAAVHEYEGTVDKFTGDGIMAIFGAPIAHEDHARRACLAALDMGERIERYATELRRSQGIELSMRIGLNSGEVVVGTIGEDLAMAYTAIGHTVGLAQRMEQIASPGQVCLSESTAALVEGYLRTSDLGELEVKGVRERVCVHELVGVGGATGSLDVARRRGLSGFVGRSEERQGLERALAQGLDGPGEVVGVVGEAGVGKSRLCHELAEAARAGGVPVFHVAAQPHTKGVPLMAALAFLRSYLGVAERDDAETARARVAEALGALGGGFDDELPLLFDFLGLPDPERPVERMDPEARRRRLLELTKRLVHAQAAHRPALTVFEDLHWLDAGSEAFLVSYLEAVTATRGLALVNFRPDYRGEWMSRSYYRQIPVGPLGEGAVEQLTSELLGSHPSLDGLSELIRERTAGNPFFIEELVRSLVEAGHLEGARGAHRLGAPIEGSTVPVTVQAVLAARIDRLTPGQKQVLEVAAVIGKEVPLPLLERATGLGAGELAASLADLVDSELLYEQGVEPETVYAFKHPLTQEVAYRSQLSERRCASHAATAQAIVEHYPDQLDERAALVAQHWEGAEEDLEAARWHARAAVWSGFNDPAEALRHWRRVRELSDALESSEETVALGLAARIAMLQFGWRLGITAESAERLFDEADRMAWGSANLHWRTLLLGGYGAVRGMGHGEIGEYATFSRRALALAEESGDRSLYMAMATNAYAFFLTNAYEEGLAVVDRALSLAEGDATLSAGVPLGCPYAFCQVLRGALLTNPGRLREAGRAIELGCRIAREHGDLETVAMSHVFASYLAWIAGDEFAALDHAGRAVETTERIGDALSRASAWAMLGAAERMHGAHAAAVEALERAERIASEGHTAFEGRSLRRSHLAEALLDAGDEERALSLALEAVELADAQRGAVFELSAQLTMARVLIRRSGELDRGGVEAALGKLGEVIETTGAIAYEPLRRVELAELHRRLGEPGEAERELREAQRLFAEIGAFGHAERLAAAIGEAAGEEPDRRTGSAR